MKKIIIFGFPHSGTTILRCIIGHIDEVQEIVDEITDFDKDITINNLSENKTHYLLKTPYTNASYFSDKYKSIIKIFIIRNPLWIFSSLNKRFIDNIPEKHKIEDYFDTIKLFIEYKNNPQENLFLIKYEDLFENNNKNIKDLLNKIGLKYNDNIFDNKNFKNKCQFCSDEIPNFLPYNTNHNVFRHYQINQPFVNNNTLDKIYLTDEQKNTIINNKDVKIIYEDIENIV